MKLVHLVGFIIQQKVRFIVFNYLIPTPQRIKCVPVKTANQFTNGSYRRSNTTIH